MKCTWPRPCREIATGEYRYWGNIGMATNAALLEGFNNIFYIEINMSVRILEAIINVDVKSNMPRTFAWNITTSNTDIYNAMMRYKVSINSTDIIDLTVCVWPSSFRGRQRYTGFLSHHSNESVFTIAVCPLNLVITFVIIVCPLCICRRI